MHAEHTSLVFCWWRWVSWGDILTWIQTAKWVLPVFNCRRAE